MKVYDVHELLYRNPTRWSSARSPGSRDLKDAPHRRFRVQPPDPHRFDANDNDGIGCEGR